MDGNARAEPCTRESAWFRSATCMVGLAQVHGSARRSAWFRFCRCMDGLKRPHFRPQNTPTTSNLRIDASTLRILAPPLRPCLEPPHPRQCPHLPDKPQHSEGGFKGAIAQGVSLCLQPHKSLKLNPFIELFSKNQLRNCGSFRALAARLRFPPSRSSRLNRSCKRCSSRRRHH